MTTERYFSYKDRRSVPHTPDTILSRAKINRPHVTVLVVEGPDDKTALGGIIDEKACDVEFLEGKGKVFECLKKVNEQKRENIVGLVDSDYERILKDAGSPPPPSIIRYLFMTDSHDMNTMVAASNAFYKACQSFKPTPDHGRLDRIRDHAVAITRQFGLVRCLSADRLHRDVRCNFREDLRLDPPHVRKYIDIPGHRADLQALLAVVKKDLPPEKQVELYRFIIEQYAGEVKVRYQKADLPWQLCQGHDLFSVLFTLLQEEAGMASGFEEFSTSLFNQFGLAELRESGMNLYERVRNWERNAEKNGKPYRIFKLSAG